MHKNIRLLPMQGAYNVRDLGGYPTRDGKQTKWRRLFRAGDLNKLTQNDLQYLQDIPLLTTIDFRNSGEVNDAPDKKPESLKEYIWLPINAGDMSDIKVTDAASIPQVMEDAYRTIIRKYQDKYKDFFRILAVEENAPILFHCSAGKDRTGIAAALTLAALGVDHKTIIEDYLLSAEYLKGKYDFLIQKYPALEPLTTVRPEYLNAALQTIDEEYGGMEHFLKYNLEIDLEKMKRLYTE